MTWHCHQNDDGPSQRQLPHRRTKLRRPPAGPLGPRRTTASESYSTRILDCKNKPTTDERGGGDVGGDEDANRLQSPSSRPSTVASILYPSFGGDSTAAAADTVGDDPIASVARVLVDYDEADDGAVAVVGVVVVAVVAAGDAEVAGDAIIFYST